MRGNRHEIMLVNAGDPSVGWDGTVMRAQASRPARCTERAVSPRAPVSQHVTKYKRPYRPPLFQRIINGNSFCKIACNLIRVTALVM
jgi:hypothetical protein